MTDKITPFPTEPKTSFSDKEIEEEREKVVDGLGGLEDETIDLIKKYATILPLDMVLLTILKWVTVRTYAVYRNLLPPSEAEKETLKDINFKAESILKISLRRKEE